MIEIIDGVTYDTDTATTLSYREITDGPHYLGCSVAMQTGCGRFFVFNTATKAVTPKSTAQIADWVAYRLIGGDERKALTAAGIDI